jgi:hypothetical protein
MSSEQLNNFVESAVLWSRGEALSSLVEDQLSTLDSWNTYGDYVQDALCDFVTTFDDAESSKSDAILASELLSWFVFGGVSE